MKSKNKIKNITDKNQLKDIDIEDFVIYEINKQQASELLNSVEINHCLDYKPLGLFYEISTLKDETTCYVGIDNYDGNAWIEEFKSLDECISWLSGE